MTKTFYIQVRTTDNIITDCIEYPVDGYEPIQMDVPLPVGLIGGWFKLENNIPVEHPELKPVSDNDRITNLEIAVANILGV